MTDFNAVLNPSNPQSFAPHLQNGYLTGFTVAQIADIDDEHKIGRVKIKLMLVDDDKIAPSGEDSYAFFLEEFTCNNMAGGSHRLLEVGTLVAVIPLHGNLQNPNWMIFGCVPNLWDRPSVECDRSRGTYGKQTREGVYDIDNAQDSSRITAFPHGVTYATTGEGDAIASTEGGASTHLKKDGTVQIQNPKGSTTIDPDGTITTENEAGASTKLTPEGEQEIRTASGALVKIAEEAVEIVGPPEEKKGLLDKLDGEISGIFGEFQEKFGNIKTLIDAALKVIEGGDLAAAADFIGQIAPEADKILSGITEHLDKAGEFLGKLDEVGVEELGEEIAGQLDRFLDADFQAVVEGVKDQLSGVGEIGEVREIFENSPLEGDDLAEFWQSLSHDENARTQLLQDVSSGGNLQRYGNVVQTGLAEVGAEVKELLSQRQSLQQESPSEEREIALQGILEKLATLLPPQIKSALPAGILETTENVAGLLSVAFQGKSQKLGDSLASVREPLRQSFSEFKNFSSTTDPEREKVEALAKAAKTLAGQVWLELQPLEDENREMQEMGNQEGASGPIARITKDKIEVSVKNEGTGGGVPLSPLLEITREKAALKSPATGGATEVFADMADAGVKSLYGQLSMGAAGAILSSAGPLLMQAAQQGMGMIFSEKLGGGILGNIGKGIDLQKLGGLNDLNPTSFISMLGKEVGLFSGLGGDGMFASPEGLFVETKGGKTNMGDFIQKGLEVFAAFGEMGDRLDELEEELAALRVLVEGLVES